jgi:hypothetical protein
VEKINKINVNSIGNLEEFLKINNAVLEDCKYNIKVDNEKNALNFLRENFETFERINYNTNTEKTKDFKIEDLEQII